MSDLRLARLYAYVETLRFTEGLPRLKASEACRSLLYYSVMTPDPMVPIIPSSTAASWRGQTNKDSRLGHSSPHAISATPQNPYTLTARSHGGHKDSICSIS